MHAFILLFALLVSPRLAAYPESGPDLDVHAYPKVPLIEDRGCDRILNFDFLVHNKGRHTLRLTEIALNVYDSAGSLALRQTINSDGLAPGIRIVAPPLLQPGQAIDIFNPRYSFDQNVPLVRLEYSFRYLIEDTPQEAAVNARRLPMDFDIETQVTVLPREYADRTELSLPLHGRIHVWEGHDFFAHHRRIPLDEGRVKKIGIDGANVNRYGSDLVLVDKSGAMSHGSPYQKTNYYVYGQPIYAPGAGRIFASRNDVPDNEFVGKTIRYGKLPQGADPDLGNFVIIDHEDGEFSILPHMKPGSVRVKTGDRVKRGDIVGQVGFSGDAIFPHVHYSLASGPDIGRSEGLPAYFHNFRRLLGGTSVEVEKGYARLRRLRGEFGEAAIAPARLGNSWAEAAPSTAFAAGGERACRRPAYAATPCNGTGPSSCATQRNSGIGSGAIGRQGNPPPRNMPAPPRTAAPGSWRRSQANTLEAKRGLTRYAGGTSSPGAGPEPRGIA